MDSRLENTTRSVFLSFPKKYENFEMGEKIINVFIIVYWIGFKSGPELDYMGFRIGFLLRDSDLIGSVSDPLTSLVQLLEFQLSRNFPLCLSMCVYLNGESNGQDELIARLRGGNGQS